jgi:hypothetical protein
MQVANMVQTLTAFTHFSRPGLKRSADAEARRLARYLAGEALLHAPA